MLCQAHGVQCEQNKQRLPSGVYREDRKERMRPPCPGGPGPQGKPSSGLPTDCKATEHIEHVTECLHF